jgi:hypothetical protein
MALGAVAGSRGRRVKRRGRRTEGSIGQRSTTPHIRKVKMISVGSEIIDEVEESPQGGDGLLGRQ